MRIHQAAAAALLTIAGPGLAAAATIDIQNIVATWSNGVPAQNVTTFGAGTANPTANWGTGGVSGYDFNSAGNVNGIVVPPSPSGDFVLGTFTHRNQPINFGTSITSIVLTVTANVIIDGNNQGPFNFVFDFDHDETDNGANPCAYGGANGQGANINGCADRVLVGVNNASQNFQIGNDIYTLNIRGFEENNVFVNQFLTRERADNTADLVANITLRTDVNTIPEPATLALFGLGLAGLGFAARRRA